MTKLAIVPKDEVDVAFGVATQQPPQEPVLFVHQQQWQDPPELAAIKRQQQEMCI